MAPGTPLAPVDEVIERLLAQVKPTPETELRAIGECVGCVLAEDITAAVDVPPVANSSMDGYALDAGDAAMKAGGEYEVSDRIAAGHVGKPLEPGTLARIFTGAPIPVGANAVIIQEDTRAAGDGRIRIETLPAPGENVRPAGQDIARGTAILEKGRRIRPQDAALMASVGVAEVRVFRPLRIAIMSTGDELVDPPGPLAPGQIFNSNHYALRGLVLNLGMDVIDLGLVPDTADATEAALEKGAALADCILSSGGVSVGEEDHVKNALEKLGQLSLWRIAIKPGKPLAFGSVQGVPFFGLPGNPVSTFVTFTMIAKPYLLAYQGMSDVMPRAVSAIADFSMAPGSRREYVRVRLSRDESGALHAAAYPNQGSGVMSSVVWADALALVDIDTTVSPGDALDVYLLE